MGQMMNSAVRLLDRAAVRYPEREAVRDEHRGITYRKYRERSQAIGTGLLKKGAPRPVVVYLPKSIDALTCFMGAMYAGSPYVPVSVAIPGRRLEALISALAPCRIVTNAQLERSLGSLELDGAEICLYEELAQELSDDGLISKALDGVVDTDPIYIMFTSGSTGIPKGVVIPHRGIIDYARWVVGTFGFDEHTVMASQAPFYFDNSTFDIYGCLQSGAKLVLTPESLFLFPSKLPQFLEENHITSIFWVPTVMINVANSGALAHHRLPELKNISFCGEVMPNKPLNIWRKHVPHCVYANLYGPTEITDVCCYYIIDREFADADPLPIGKACENTRVLILTEEGKPAAVHEPGELCVIGSGVGLGYWKEPEITGQVFVANPLCSAYPERMYRTGDLAYICEEGLIMFLGRSDNQIKLKGNRIELGEIEQAAVCVDGVENACAIFDPENQEIVLFVQTKKLYTKRLFNVELREHIPQYMLPGKLIPLAELPRTANDKIDRTFLRAVLNERRPT